MVKSSKYTRGTTMSLTDDQLSNESLDACTDRIHNWFATAHHSYAQSTIRAYRRNWQVFTEWCANFDDPKTGVRAPKQAMPASWETVVDFVRSLIGYRAPESIRQCLNTISKMHQVADVLNPTKYEYANYIIKSELGQGLTSQHIEERRPHHNIARLQRRAKGLTRIELSKIRSSLQVEPLIDPQGLPVSKARSIRKQNKIWFKSARDRALIHLAYDALLHVSELARVTLEDLRFISDGTGQLVVHPWHHTKNTQEYGAKITQVTVLEIQRWCQMANLHRGPLFPSLKLNAAVRTDIRGRQKALAPNSIQEIYKNVMKKIGEDPRLYSTQSTRIGATMDMLEDGLDLALIIKAGRWKSGEIPYRYAKQIDWREGGMAQLSKKLNR